MRKYICTLVICLVFTCLFSAEKEDLYFIKALMQDKYYQMAYDESVIFLKKYPNTDVKDELLLIQADILIQQKNYTKAIHIYQKLSLKYPQKSVYFANQILEIQQKLK